MNLALSEEEHEALTKAARVAGVTLAEYIRQAARERLAQAGQP